MTPESHTPAQDSSTQLTNSSLISDLAPKENVNSKEDELNDQLRIIQRKEGWAYICLRRVFYISIIMLVSAIFIFDTFFISLNRNSLKNEVLAAESNQLALVAKLVQASVNEDNIYLIEQDFTDWIKRNHSVSKIELKDSYGKTLISVGDPDFKGEEQISFFEEIVGKNKQPYELEIYTDKDHLIQKFRQVTPSTLAFLIIFSMMVVLSYTFAFKHFAAEPLRQALIAKNQAQAELKQSHALYSAIVEEAPEMIIRYNIQHKINFVNKTFSIHVKKPLEQVIGKNIWGFFSREGKRAYIDSLKPITPQNPERSFACPIVLPDSTIVWCQWTERAFFNENKQLQFYQMVGTDITNLKQEEQLIENGETRYQNFVEAAGEYLWQIDNEGKYVYVSSQLSDILGYTNEEMIGKFFNEFIILAEVEAGKHKADLDMIISQKAELRNFEYRSKTKSDKEIWLSISASPLLDEASNFLGYRGTGRDITENRKLIFDILMSKEKSETENRTKNEFLSRVNQELRKSLNTIENYAQLIIIHTEPNDDVEEYISGIGTHVEFLSNLANSISDYENSKLKNTILKQETFDAYEVIEKTVQEFIAPCASKNLSLILNIDPNLPHYINSDAARLKQIISIFLNNAIQGTEKGKIEVNIEYAQSKINEQIQENLNYLTIRVQDTGMGMDEDDVKELVSYFDQVRDSDNTTSGLKLGVIALKPSVELMKGQLKIKSKKGEGSEFTVVLPIALSENELYQGKESILPGLQKLKNKKVLVVDESVSEGLYLKQSMERWGLQVYLNQNPHQWIDSRTINTDYDLIIIDSTLLPGVDLESFNQKLRAQIPKLDFLFITPMKIITLNKLEAESNFNEITRPIFTHSLLSKLYKIFEIGQRTKPKILKESNQDPLSQEKITSLFSSLKVLLIENNIINRKVLKLILGRLNIETDEAESLALALDLMHNKDYHMIFMNLQLPEIQGAQVALHIRNGEAGEINSKAYITGLVDNMEAIDQEYYIQMGIDSFIAKPIKPSAIEKLLLENCAVEQAVLKETV